MHRPRLIMILESGVLAAILAALLLPASAFAAEPTTPPADPAIDLRCALVIPAAHPARDRVVCRWSALEGVDVRVYRLWRITDPPLGHHRKLVARVKPDKALRAVDRSLRSGHTYGYRVIAIGTDGTRVGTSGQVKVRVGAKAQALKLRCAYVIDATRQGVSCHWAKSKRPATVRYVLYRSVDGGAREVIDRVGPHGRRTSFDKDVVAGQSIRYKVVAITRHHRVVGVGGPDLVVIPTIVPSAAAA